MKNLVTVLLSLILLANLTSAIIVDSVDVQPIAPGDEGQIRIELENVFDEEATDVSIRLNFNNSPFTPVGSSEQSIDEIDEDDDEDFIFRIRASPTIEPGDYEIPFTIQYTLDDDDFERSGSIGVRVQAEPELVYSVESDNAIQNRQSQITLRIINKGFFDARFVLVKIIPDGFTLLSEDEVYIGEIESDDFETATFDIVPTSRNPSLTALIEYRNFENKLERDTISLPIRVYTAEEAARLGVTQQSNAPLLIAILITLILLWILWRTFKRLRRSRKNEKEKRR